MRALYSSFRGLVYQSFASLFKTQLRRRVIVSALVLSLIILPIHSSAYEGVKEIASSSYHLTVAPFRFIPKLFKRWFSSSPQQTVRERLADRINAVSRISISPLKFVAYQGQSLTFSAQGLNFNDQTIPGVRFSWESSDTEKVQIDEAGQARFLQPGQARLTCRAGIASASVPVLIRAGSRPPQTDEEWRIDQGTLRPDGTTSTGVGRFLPTLPQLLEKLMPRDSIESCGNRNW